MIDICGGNGSEDMEEEMVEEQYEGQIKSGSKNYGMCKCLSHPITYIKNTLKIKTIFRFILSHPDMDHMDGLNNLFTDNDIKILNFWDTGARREKPDFDNNKRYKEIDWTTYLELINNDNNGLTKISPKEGAKGKYYSENEDEEEDYDRLYIYNPSKDIVDRFNNQEIDLNDTSYVLCYWSYGGRILIPGDSHDFSLGKCNRRIWKYVIELRNINCSTSW